MSPIGTGAVLIGKARPETMLRITKIADYGVVVLACFVRHPASTVLSATAIAEHTGLPAPTVSKILKVLAHGGLVNSHRGAHGGYALARSAAEISVVAVIEALDGPLAITECADPFFDACEQECCDLRGYWPRVNNIIRGALSAVSIAQISGFEPLEFPETTEPDALDASAGR